MLFPRVKHLKANGSYSYDKEITAAVKGITGLDENIITTVFGKVAEKGSLELYCEKDIYLLEYSPEA